MGGEHKEDLKKGGGQGEEDHLWQNFQVPSNHAADHKEERKKGGHVGGDGCQHRSENLPASFQGRSCHRQTCFYVTKDILEHHNSVIHHHPEHEDEAKKGHTVNGEPEDFHEGEREEKRDRYTNGGVDGVTHTHRYEKDEENSDNSQTRIGLEFSDPLLGHL